MNDSSVDLLDRLELRDLLAQATSLVESACALVRKRVEDGFSFRLKPDSSFVTDVDLAVEEFLRSELSRRFPEHGILGEELGVERSGSEVRWIVDPVDGTLSLRHGIPLYGVLLALELRGEPLVGVLGLPGLGRVYAAARGLGAHCNGEPLSTGDVASDEEARTEILAVADHAQFVRAGYEDLFGELLALHPVLRTYPDAFGHALAVQGSVGAMIDLGIRRWDVAATRVLVQEAGGLFVRLRVAGQDEDGERFDVLFGKPRVVRRLLERLPSLPIAEPGSGAAGRREPL